MYIYNSKKNVNKIMTSMSKKKLDAHSLKYIFIYIHSMQVKHHRKKYYDDIRISHNIKLDRDPSKYV